MKSLFLKAPEVLMGIAMFTSCEKDELNSTHSAQEVIKNEKVSVQEGYLVFPNFTKFEETRNEVIQMSSEEIDQWENNFGSFESQRAIYNRAVDLDYDHKMQLEALVYAGERKVDEILEKKDHISPYVKENQHLFNFNEDGTFDLKVAGYHPYIENFINKEGIVQVGDSIFHYSDGYIRILIDGDEQKLSIVQSFNESSLKNNVKVIKVETTKYRTGKEGGINAYFEGDDECIGYTNGGGQRVIGTTVVGMKFSNDVYGQYGCHPGMLMSQPYAFLRAENQIKNLFGWSKKNTDQLRIDGVVSWSAPNYGFSGQNNVVVSSGSNDDKSITSYLFITPQWYCGVGEVNMSGNVTFKGRHGSTCSL